MNDTSTQEDTHEKWIVIAGEGRDNWNQPTENDMDTMD